MSAAVILYTSVSCLTSARDSVSTSSAHLPSAVFSARKRVCHSLSTCAALRLAFFFLLPSTLLAAYLLLSWLRSSIFAA